MVTSGSLTIRADSVGRDTRVGRIISRVEEAQSDRAPIQTVATRFTQRFVPVSFALAAVTYAVTSDARRAMTMLLIACPCAAGLATPTAISAASAREPAAAPSSRAAPTWKALAGSRRSSSTRRAPSPSAAPWSRAW
ncbi:hypothetical protein ACFWP3_10980 [Streptomyces sp. NPDC058525]|uniref:P-type ATPase n=1 Tax=Streptomyces sp. NPDC058525 TaxID=3346538 RepID=UPI00365F7101